MSMPSTAGPEHTDDTARPVGTAFRLRVAVFISGRGSNLQALIDASAVRDYPAEVVLVISNQPGAPGLDRARRAGIPAITIADPNRAAFAAQAAAALRDANVELIALAGFMRILDVGFVETWCDRLLNIHPSLLPAFPGLHPERQALAAGVRFSGCTVHFVRPKVDTGPIVAQAVVPIHSDDDEERLSARILEMEHRLYPLAVRLYAEGRLMIVGGRVSVADWIAPEFAALNPTEPLVRAGG
jgi:phosphoribosylglycinamide formyltransferase-1